MSICEGISKNNYICKDEKNKYTINTTSTNPVFQNINPENIQINEAKTEFGLTPKTANHYFLAEETAHCSEKWQHWFCIPNYHNRNKIIKVPDTDMMSVGKCYTYCNDDGSGSGGSAATSTLSSVPSQNNVAKCSIYNSEESEADILFNPLAIIAMFGTNFYNRTTDPVIPHYNNIRDTVGIRGSYLNDLYRVNNSNDFITLEQQRHILANTAITKENYGKQQKLILRIINVFITRGMDDDPMRMSREIRHIKKDIEKASEMFIQKYIKDIKYTKNKQDRLLIKIRDYQFNTDILESVFGKDKNAKDKLKNAISYANIIMNFVCKDGAASIDKRIRQLFKFNNVAASLVGKDEENLIKIFKTACYSCFSINHERFETYVRTSVGRDGDKVFYNEETKAILYDGGGAATFLHKCDISENDIGVVSSEIKYKLPYYNNITFYDHQILSEYSDNEKSFVYILTIFGLFLGFIAGLCLIYAILLYISPPKGIALSWINSYLNYCSLFYSFITITVINVFCPLYYYLLCRYSKSNYTVVSLFFKIINVVIIFSVLSYAVNTLFNLLNINYCLLSNENNGEDCDNSQYVYWYMVQLYLIAIYVYSMYLMRYGRTDVEYDIIVNHDVTPEHSEQYRHLLLVENYLTYIVSMFSIYTKNELAMAVKANAANVKKAATVADTAPVAMYGTDNPSGFGTGGVPFTYGDDFGTNIPTFNPLTTLNPTQALAHAQALAIPTVPVSPISPARFLQAQGVPSKIL
jgi:MFS family permease